MKKLKDKKNFTICRLSFLRKAIRASASVTKSKNSIHFITEIDVTKILNRLDEIKKNGIHITFTSYLVKAFSLTVEKYKWMNSFISHGKQVFLDDIAISVLIERQIENISVPEPLVIHEVDKKTPTQISNELKQAKEKSQKGKSLGDLSGSWYFKFIPGWLLKTFIKLAEQNINMGLKFGKLAITSMGMFSQRPIWVVPHGSATILLSVGTTSLDGTENEKKKLHLTITFDHDIVDGAPAVRFVEDLSKEIEEGNFI